MSKQLKRYLASDVKSRLGDSRDVVVVQLSGLSVEKSNDLRGKLRAEGAHMTVLRNRVATKAFDELGMEGLGDVLDGMSAIAHGEGDEMVLAVSRVLADWTKANKDAGIKVLGGYMDGKVLEAKDVATLATLPTRDQLLSMIASAVVAPMQNIAGQLNEMLSGVARAVDAVHGQKAASEG
jgi:large subunit ribosomal protein L10